MLGQHSYELSSGFVQFFVERLRRLPDAVRFPDSKRKAGDAAAWVLYDGCMTHGVPGKPRLRGPILLWLGDRPVSEGWRGLGELHVPPERRVVFEDPGPGRSLQIPKSDGYLSPRIGLRVHSKNNRNDLPKITIEIEGEQACILMKALVYRFDVAGEERAVRNDAKRIWDPILQGTESDPRDRTTSRG